MASGYVRVGTGNEYNDPPPQAYNEYAMVPNKMPTRGSRYQWQTPPQQNPAPAPARDSQRGARSRQLGYQRQPSVNQFSDPEYQPQPNMNQTGMGQSEGTGNPPRAQAPRNQPQAQAPRNQSRAQPHNQDPTTTPQPPPAHGYQLPAPQMHQHYTPPSQPPAAGHGHVLKQSAQQQRHQPVGQEDSSSSGTHRKEASVTLANKGKMEQLQPCPKQQLIKEKMDEAKKETKSKIISRKKRGEKRYEEWSAIHQDLTELEKYKQENKRLTTELCEHQATEYNIRQLLRTAGKTNTQGHSNMQNELPDLYKLIQQLVEENKGSKRELCEHQGTEYNIRKLLQAARTNDTPSMQQGHGNVQDQPPDLFQLIQQLLNENKTLRQNQAQHPIQGVRMINVAPAAEVHQASEATYVNMRVGTDYQNSRAPNQESVQLSEDQASLKSTVYSLNKKMEEMQRDNTALKTENQNLRSTRTILGNKNSQLEAECNKMKAQVERMSKQQNENYSLKNEISQLKYDLGVSEDKNANMKSQMDAINTTLRKLQSEHAELNNENHGLKAAWTTLENKTSQLEAERTRLNNEVSALTIQIDTMKSENDDLKKQQERISRREEIPVRNDAPEEAAQMTNQHINMAAQLTRQSPELQESIKTAKGVQEENNQLREWCQRYSQQLTEQTKQSELEKNKIRQIEQENKELLRKLNTAEENAKLQSSQLQNVLQQNTQRKAEREIESLKEQISRQAQVCEVDKENLAHLKNENNHLRTEIDRLKNETIRQIEEERKELSRRLKTAEENMSLQSSQLQKAVPQNKQRKTELETEIESLREKISQQTQASEVDSGNIAHLKNENDHLKNEYGRLKTENDRLKNEIDRLKNEMEDERRKMEKELDVWVGKTERKDKRIQGMEDKEEKQRKKIARLENDWDDDIAHWERKYQRREQELEREISELTVTMPEIAELQNQLDSVKNQMVQKESENATLKNENRDLRNARTTLWNKTSQLEAECRKMNNETCELKAEVERMKSEIDELRKQQDNNNSLKNENTRLTYHNSASKAVITKLQHQLDSVKTQMMQKESQNIALTNENENLRSACTTLENKTTQLEAECKKIKVKGKRMNSRIKDLKKQLERTRRDLLNQDLEKKMCELKRSIWDIEWNLHREEGRMYLIGRHSVVKEPSVAPSIVLPRSSCDDDRITTVFQQLMRQLRNKGLNGSLVVKDGPDITPHDGIVILPCIVSFGVDRDLSTVVDKAKLGSGLRLVIIIFNHKPKHNSQIAVPTRDRLSDRETVERCLLFLDAIFWHRSMYKCNVNQELVNQLIAVLCEEEEPCAGLRIVLPRSSHEDERITPVYQQLIQQLRNKGLNFNEVVKDGPDITPHDGITILPCIAASRVGSDLFVALDKAKLGPRVRLVIIIFNHKAPHDCRIAVPTRDRLSDRETVERCLLFLDAIFWQGSMYDCPVNHELVNQLKDVLSED